jgi:hypothetical protein
MADARTVPPEHQVGSDIIYLLRYVFRSPALTTNIY